MGSSQDVESIAANVDLKGMTSQHYLVVNGFNTLPLGVLAPIALYRSLAASRGACRVAQCAWNYGMIHSGKEGKSRTRWTFRWCDRGIKE